MSVSGTQVEDKMRRFKGECAHFSFNRCPVYTHDGASAKSSTNSQETDKVQGEMHDILDFRLELYIRSIPHTVVLHNPITEQIDLSPIKNIFNSSISQPWTTGRTQRGFLH